MGTPPRYVNPKSPEEFESSRLDALDFDGTMYATFEQEPHLGIYGVDEAYRIAIEESFPFDRDALKKYEDQGGHNNRTPLEIVDSLAPNCTPAGLEKITSDLVKAKLGVLEKQIGKLLSDGTTWPRPIPGFVDYYQTVHDAKALGQNIDIAVLSAGHASFIRKCLETSGLESPEIMVTDETIRGLNSALPPSQLAKPAVFPLSLVKVQWLSLYNLMEIPETDTDVNSRITMIGDSEEKDGSLAANAGINFIHINHENSQEAYEKLKVSHSVGQTAAAGYGT